MTKPATKKSTTAAVFLPEVNFSDFGDVRYLHLGTLWVQGSMLLDAPYDIELEYVQRMMAGLLKNVVMNPYSHPSAPNIPKNEVQQAISTVE
jgi:hypothetical protein